ncbi:MAG: SCO family protein [Vicinamibacterales bacterium]
MSRLGGIMVALVAVAACSRAPEPKQYELKGQVLGLQPEASEVLIKHEDIQGFMPGMTMPFKVRDAKLLHGLEPGDLVTATLVVGETEAHLSALTRTGHAELDVPPPGPAFSGFELLKNGETVPDELLIDQDGKARPLSTLRGHRVALTFIYTRCPMPDYCPLMDRHFQALQREVTKNPALSDVRLVSVSFDPQFDTPPVLKAHAERLQADPRVWSFVTGEREAITRFAARFGVSVERAEQNPIEITHNLRTAIIDREGRVVNVHTGNSWTPADVLADLNATPAPTN